ncbi:hypothetical protein [Lacticaseibacillus sp. N501-2]|uniref:hypothetical protein n=1 Tax=Lacticaseibacillus salsurae TaxID=3367729 RepID=UPI0038B22DB6
MKTSLTSLDIDVLLIVHREIEQILRTGKSITIARANELDHLIKEASEELLSLMEWQDMRSFGSRLVLNSLFWELDRTQPVSDIQRQIVNALSALEALKRMDKLSRGLLKWRPNVVDFMDYLSGNRLVLVDSISIESF